MEGSLQDGGSFESNYVDGTTRKERSGDHNCSSSCSGSSFYRLFGRQRTIHQIMGGGRAADVILWKERYLSFGVVIIATVVWLLVEWSGISFLSITSDVLLVLVIIQFVRANSFSLLNKQLKPLPELVLSEEMVNNAASSFRVKINNMLLMAHDITLGKDFKLFIKAVIFLWLLSVVGGFFSFFTIAYIGTILAITMPVLYDRYEKHVDRYAGLIHQKISKHYKVVDETVISRLPRSLSKNKDA